MKQILEFFPDEDPSDDLRLNRIMLLPRIVRAICEFSKWLRDKQKYENVSTIELEEIVQAWRDALDGLDPFML